MRYKVQWNYASGMGGPWRAGEVVEIDNTAVAEAINVDSPGVLVPEGVGRAGVTIDAEPATRDMAEPPATRQVTTAARRGRSSSAGA